MNEGGSPMELIRSIRGSAKPGRVGLRASASLIDWENWLDSSSPALVSSASSTMCSTSSASCALTFAAGWSPLAAGSNACLCIALRSLTLCATGAHQPGYGRHHRYTETALELLGVAGGPISPAEQVDVSPDRGQTDKKHKDRWHETRVVADES